MEQNNEGKKMPIPDKSIGLIKITSNEQLQRNEDGTLILNSKNLQILCLREGLYQYPQMNNKLYLHFKVIAKIQALEAYFNVKTLYLESNVIKKIQNLQCLPQLENLFLQNNMITKIEGLDANKQLKILNLSYNNIFQLEGLSGLMKLQTLSITNNYLKTITDLYHIGQCSETLTSIDFSGNKIQADEKLLDLIPQVKCLYLYGNPLVRQMYHYRRTVIGRLHHLLYLDQRTIDKEERILSEAFVNGGQKGYKEARSQVLAQRQSDKKDARKQLVESMDFHRANKIRRFEANIKQFNDEINTLKGYIEEKGNQDMRYFYQNRINELLVSIKQTQDFIDSNKKRMSSKNLVEQKYNIVMSADEGFKKNKNTLNTNDLQRQSQNTKGTEAAPNSQILRSITPEESLLQGGQYIQIQPNYQFMGEQSTQSMENHEEHHSTNESHQENSQHRQTSSRSTNQNSASLTYTGSVQTYYSYEQLD